MGPKKFQKIANTLVKAIRRKHPDLFTIPFEEVARIKDFTRLEPLERDTWGLENYLDDNLLVMYTLRQIAEQLPALRVFMDEAGVEVKYVEDDGPIFPVIRNVILYFKSDTVLKASTWKDVHVNKVLGVLKPLADGTCKFIE